MLSQRRKERNIMILDNFDLLMLRLAGKYRWLPSGSLGAFRQDAHKAGIDALFGLGFMKAARGGKYVMLTQKGCKFLRGLGHPADGAGNRAYENNPALRRRLEVCRVMLTALRAGTDTLRDGVDSLREQPVFYPAFALRTGEGNLMNAASCVGFGHWGDAVYMLQYAGAESRGMYLSNELSRLRGIAAVYGGLNAPAAMIFAGESCAEVYERVQRAAPREAQSRTVRGFTDYADAYRLCDVPVHLLSCDETGAVQLAIMSEPGYRDKIAFAAFGGKLTRDADIPGADGCVDGRPLVIAADMDVRRVFRVIAEAQRLGRREVMLAALRGQIRDFWLKTLPKDKGVTPLVIGENVLTAAFGKPITLYTPPRGAAVDKNGELIYA
jgi:hypothetical protein